MNTNNTKGNFRLMKVSLAINSGFSEIAQPTDIDEKKTPSGRRL